MAIELEPGSGVRRTGTSEPSGDRPSEGTLKACREIIDAASALSLDLEFLTGGADEGSKQFAAEAARSSIERIVKLAERIRKTPDRRRDLDGTGIE